MSGLPLINYEVTESNITREQLAVIYGVNQLDGDTFPLTYRTINKYQRKDKELAEKLKCANYHTKSFCGGGNTFMLIYKNYKIVMTTTLRKYVVDWYHTYLLYPGMQRTEASISHYYYWTQLRDDIQTHIKFCKTCHKNKKHNFKCGKLSSTEAETIPWDILSVDIIGPYKIRI